MPEAPHAFRRARADDVQDIVRMLADDPLGAMRERYESPLPESYARAFRAIAGDPNNELVVAGRGERVPSLTCQGGWRALIEGVRVDRSERSQGLGKALVEWAIAPTRPDPTPAGSTRAWGPSPLTKE